MKRIIHRLIQGAARTFRGQSYTLDPSLPVSSLLGIALRRNVSLLRCLLRGVVISPDPRRLVFLGPGAEVRNRSLVRFGRGVTLGKGSIIDGLSREGVILGDGVTIGPYSIIEATGVITSIGKGCRIGRNSGLGAFSFIGAAGGVTIGDNVIMGQRVSFHSENHVCDRTDLPIRLQGVTRKGITVEDDCWIGANVTFLDGAYVGRGSVIAAGAVVRGTVPPFSVAAGVPAKVLRSRKEEAEA